MLQRIKQLQTKAVDKIYSLLTASSSINQKEYIFQAPTGSGKTHMIAELMDKMLQNNPNIVFIVSSLSTSNLAHQNYEKFVSYQNTEFSYLDPFEILSVSTEQERMHIETTHNVYVLARDLYKEKSKLMTTNSLCEFLEEIKLQNKEIIWIKDECHIKSKNLDFLKEYFSKVLNISATPNSTPDVYISDIDAVNNKLIKYVELHNDESDTLPDYGIRQYLQIKKDYQRLLNINPCLIIQISNKDKGEEEWKKIKNLLDTEFAGIQYACISNEPKMCATNSEILLKSKISDWKNIIKENDSLVSVIIFKMIINVGYDIPRACMLYQVRETSSETLDEQVIGRVRRNPILVDWEDYSEEAHNLALKAIVYGIEKKKNRIFKKASLVKEKTFDIKTTKLNSLWNETKSNFNLTKFVKNQNLDENDKPSIFECYKKWRSVDDLTSAKCWEYISSEPYKWYEISKLLEKIKNENNNYMADYSKSMEIDTVVHFPNNVIYEIIDINSPIRIEDWIWEQKLNNDYDYDYYFDSKAERTFAMMLKDCGFNVWGKNFYASADDKNLVKFEYINYESHDSYPDFVLYLNGTIHIFETKSYIGNNNTIIDSEQYKQKVNALKAAYKSASKVTMQCFYIPIEVLNPIGKVVWEITKFQNGKEKVYKDVNSSKRLKDIINCEL